MAQAQRNNPTISTKLPEEVETCLLKTRFVNLATSNENVPHISLMNYTYIANSPFDAGPIIAMTSPPQSRKIHNLQKNPHVALSAHDWVSPRPLSYGRENSPEPSALTALLLGINSASLSKICVTINGTASLVPAGSEQEKWYKKRHIENNTFAAEQAANGLASEDAHAASPDGGKEAYIKAEGVRVLVVKITGGSTVDWQGAEQKWEVRQLSNGV
ncbi:pyridoxamine phosphate oxidase-like protein [Mytilinidion resinicola]|uniref:Pyridoxamine phosphate oxidase-like protein n=1 Tax=Mytilinidion resinicola TaxID=574789 RepID=A0A6A6Y8X8_9PEZI|nr:pyridoxamine phosphate oxidase-like protein [Mytilinidion resinicola]KAF2805272.1 pyridoxamine phosphate oxidase-like protein [Mytilinidion resinicola]